LLKVGNIPLLRDMGIRRKCFEGGSTSVMIMCPVLPFKVHKNSCATEVVHFASYSMTIIHFSV